MDEAVIESIADLIMNSGGKTMTELNRALPYGAHTLKENVEYMIAKKGLVGAPQMRDGMSLFVYNLSDSFLENLAEAQACRPKH